MRGFATMLACLAVTTAGGCRGSVPSVPLDPAEGLVAGAIAGAALGAGVGAIAGGAIGFTAGTAIGAAGGGAAGAGIAGGDPVPAQQALTPGGDRVELAGGEGPPDSGTAGAPSRSGAGGGRAPTTVPGPERARLVQERLAAVGFDPGPADGVVGPRTRAALRAFQEARGLDPTGEPNQATLMELGVE